MPSQPIRAAWIEIKDPLFGFAGSGLSQPIRAAWIEINMRIRYIVSFKSQPIRAAWIEIAFPRIVSIRLYVAAHSGCVD